MAIGERFMGQKDFKGVSASVVVNAVVVSVGVVDVSATSNHVYMHVHAYTMKPKKNSLKTPWTLLI